MEGGGESSISDDYNDVSPLTQGQLVTLESTSLVSGLLSALGSSIIVYKVWSNRDKARSYDRLLLGLSASDFVASLTYAFWGMTLPRDTSQRVWAMGTEVTCAFSGFLAQFALSAVIYNGMLSYYYLLSIKFGVKQEDFGRRYEKWMHIVTISFSTITAIVGLAVGLYREISFGVGCWIAEYPKGCREEGGCIHQYFGYVFGGLPLAFTFISLIINNAIIICHVKNSLATPQRKDKGSSSSRDYVNRSHVREITIQCFLYVSSFFLCYLPTFALRIYAVGKLREDEGDIYWLLLMEATLRPLQGFLNLFVYNRSNYFKVRAAHPGRDWIWCVKKAFFEWEIPSMSQAAASSIQTSKPKELQKIPFPEDTTAHKHSGIPKEYNVSKAGAKVSDISLSGFSLIASVDKSTIAETDEFSKTFANFSDNSVSQFSLVELHSIREEDEPTGMDAAPKQPARIQSFAEEVELSSSSHQSEAGRTFERCSDQSLDSPPLVPPRVESQFDDPEDPEDCDSNASPILAQIQPSRIIPSL